MIEVKSEYIEYRVDNIRVVFTTKKNNKNYNRNTYEGKENLENLKSLYNLEDVIYTNQIHSDVIIDYDGSEDIENSRGDGIITNLNNVAIGVFTADCVPVIMVDEEKKVIAAIHSGWRGTISNIVGKAIDAMEVKYSSISKNIKVFIGPHNKECCYEVSEELINRFKEDGIFKDDETIHNGRYLNLQRCIEIQLLDRHVLQENINCCNLCTYCDNHIKFYSYRREEDREGRMYSFVFIE